MKQTLLVLVFFSAQFSAAARADELEDRFATVWESLWTQAGSPTYVIRWQSEVKVRFTGPNVERFRDYVFGALRDVTAAAGLSLLDVSAESDAAELSNLEFRMVEEPALDSNMPCVTSLQRWRRWLLEKVLIQSLGRNTWNCAHHEVMHAMGIRGHPSGRTVLSYFPPRRDQLMDMDILMLKAWYSPQMKPGATPFEALQVMTDAVIEATVAAGERGKARAAQAAFLRSRLMEMERYARGEGEVPTVVFRSGRGTPKAMADGQNLMAYFVAVAHFYGIGTHADRQQAQQWAERAADKGVAAARNALESFKKAPGP